MRKITAIFFASFFISMASLAKSDSAIKIEKPVIAKVDTNALSEGKAYKMLYENQKAANDKILSTIFYALGGLATAMILVFASNWWFNEKKVDDLRSGIGNQINELSSKGLSELKEKINALSTEKASEISNMQIKLQEEVTANSKSVASEFSKFTERIRAEVKEDNSLLRQSFQQNLEAFTQTYNQQINSMHASFEERITGIKELIIQTEKLAKEERVLFENKIVFAEKRARRELYRLGGYYWETAGVLVNSLMSYVRECNLCIDIDYDCYLALISAREILEKIAEIDQNDKDEINRLLVRIESPKYRASIMKEKELVIKRLESIKIRTK